MRKQPNYTDFLRISNTRTDCITTIHHSGHIIDLWRTFLHSNYQTISSHTMHFPYLFLPASIAGNLKLHHSFPTTECPCPAWWPSPSPPWGKGWQLLCVCCSAWDQGPSSQVVTTRLFCSRLASEKQTTSPYFPPNLKVSVTRVIFQPNIQYFEITSLTGII